MRATPLTRRILLFATVAAATVARGGPRPAAGAAPPGPFIEVVPTGGQAPVHIAAEQVVRVARAEGYTVIDTTAWV